MPTRTTFSFSDPAYPARLRELSNPPLVLTTTCDLETPSRRVAIVGSRDACDFALAYARDLAAQIASRGGIVVSGGAVGVDTAAHEGALAAGGRTWVIAPTGAAHVFPDSNAALFTRVEESAGGMVWPYADDTDTHRSRFIQRNGVLAVLADVVVVVQAGIPSGALNAASWARKQKRPLWIVTPPAMVKDVDILYAGSLSELDRGARPLFTTKHFLSEITLAGDAQTPTRPHALPEPLSTALTNKPQHIELLSEKAGIPLSTTVSLLLTLALEDVVVEGPQGFFRLA